MTINPRTMLEFLGFLLGPVFAAGGAWAGVQFALRELRELRAGQARTAARVANLYGHLRLPFPPGDSLN